MRLDGKLWSSAVALLSAMAASIAALGMVLCRVRPRITARECDAPRIALIAVVCVDKTAPC